MLCHVGDAMTLSLVRGTQGRGVWVRDLAGSTCCVLVQNTLLAQGLPPHKSNNGYLGSLVKYLGGGGGGEEWSSDTLTCLMLRKT